MEFVNVDGPQKIQFKFKFNLILNLAIAIIDLW